MVSCGAALSLGVSPDSRDGNEEEDGLESMTRVRKTGEQTRQGRAVQKKGNDFLGHREGGKFRHREAIEEQGREKEC